MCYAFYLAADRIFPAVDSPHLTIVPLSPDTREHARLLPHVGHPHLHLCTSCTGCGCGFQNNPPDLEPHDPDSAQSQRDLAAYFNARLGEGASMQLAVCWSGEEHEPPRYRTPLNPDRIGRDLFRFDTRSLLTITREERRIPPSSPTAPPPPRSKRFHQRPPPARHILPLQESPMPDQTVRLHRVLRCPPDRLYRAFIDPQAMVKWLPPNGFVGLVHSIDPRPGGEYAMSFTNFNTGQSHSFRGKYIELRPGQSLRYTDRFDDPNLPGEMQVTVTLHAVSGGTELTIIQDNIPAAIPAEMCYLGWQESLEALARLVEPAIP